MIDVLEIAHGCGDHDAASLDDVELRRRCGSCSLELGNALQRLAAIGFAPLTYAELHEGLRLELEIIRSERRQHHLVEQLAAHGYFEALPPAGALPTGDRGQASPPRLGEREFGAGLLLSPSRPDVVPGSATS